MDKSVKGLNITNKQLKDNEKNNKVYHKEFDTKFKKYLKTDNEQITDKKYIASEKQIENFEDANRGEGMQNLKYDSEPTKQFKDRAEKAIIGDSTMGNKDDIAINDFGKEFIDKTKRRNKKLDDNTLDFVAVGNDIELTGKKVKGKPIAFESVISKKLKLNKELTNLNLINQIIPENYKIDSNVILIEDTNKTIKTTWNGGVLGYATITEMIDKTKNQNTINEIIKRFNYGK